jgi:fused signal recognition particle receptor
MFDSIKDRLKKFVGKTEEAAEKEFKEISALSTEVTGQKIEIPEELRNIPIEKNIKLSPTTQLKGIFSKNIRLSEKDLEGALQELQMDLLENDVAYETSQAIVDELKVKLMEREIEKDQIDLYIRACLMMTLLDVLTPDKEIDLLELIMNSPKPFKIVFFGVNGTGKTTTIAKVGKYLNDQGYSVVLAAGDTFRAGAIEQLEKHGEMLKLKIVKHQKSGDAAAVIYDAIEHAKARGIDVVLADTAGRMQTNTNLMDEMKKIVRVNKPDLKIFIGDSLTGNDAIEQAEKFNTEIGIDAVILTKMDADTKGGSALSISHVTKRPILFIGMGQKYDDLKRFDKKWFVGQIVTEN